MPIDWTQPIQTAGGRPGKLLERQPWQERVGDTRRRVEVCNYQRPRTDTEKQSITVYLCGDDGKVRGDGQPSDFDIINVADALSKAA